MERNYGTYHTRPDLCWQKFELMTNLEAEADPQNEGGHTGDEAAKECIEGEGSNQTAVHELKINKTGRPNRYPVAVHRQCVLRSQINRPGTGTSKSRGFIKPTSHFQKSIGSVLEKLIVQTHTDKYFQC